MFDNDAEGSNALTWLKIGGGTLLVLAGLKQRSVSGAVLAAAGALLVANGARDRNAMMQQNARGGSTTSARAGDITDEIGTEYPEGSTRRWKDTVQESSEESFPASDAPSWTPTSALGRHTRE